MDAPTTLPSAAPEVKPNQVPAGIKKLLSQPSVKQGIRLPKIHLIYFALAAFDLVAVGTGFYLSHTVMGIYTQSVSVNEEWASRTSRFTKLGELASAANAPGNDVFDSHDVAKERQRRDIALEAFNAGIRALREEIRPYHATELPAALGRIESAMSEMIAEADLIFRYFELNDADQAGSRMATMDRKYAVLTGAVNDTLEIIQKIQADNFAGQIAQARSLGRFEYVIGLAILVMVACATLYGHYIGRLIRRQYEEALAHAETQRFAERLQGLNDDITKLNVDLAHNMKQLQEAQDEIVRKGRLAQLGQLTATVAHEIRNPLGTVRTAAYLIERKTQGKGLGLESPLQRINGGVSRCDGIITELLDFARSKSLLLETRTVDEWLAGVLQEEGQKLPKAVRIECRPGLKDLNATFDPGRMQRVLINLLSNAAEAMVGKGEDPAGFATAEPRITVQSKLASRGVEITVSDNGPGISEENRKKILEPLFTTKSFGVGLGLPAVEKILEQHRGGLEISSTPGQGASFTAWFPVGQAEREAA